MPARHLPPSTFRGLSRIPTRPVLGWLHRSPLWLRASGMVAAVLVLVASLPLPARAADDGGVWQAGISARGQASAADVGLPAYPGAKRYVEPREPARNPERGAERASDAQRDRNSSQVQLSAVFGAFGLKLAVAKYQTPDSAEQVAAFYRPALAAYGPVLDCADPAAPRKPATRREGSEDGPLACDDETPEAGKRSFKVGSRQHQRILAIESRPGQDTVFSLVRVDLRLP
jgi:hypothetical protein